jgi:hypothetical protein
MSRLAGAWPSVAIRFPLLLLFALATFLGTGFLIAAGLSLANSEPITSSGNLSMGLICALIVWLFVAAFHLRRETVTLPAPERDRFLQDARLLLTEMGYEVTARGPMQLSTRPRFNALLLGGGVHVSYQPGRGELTGPKVCVEVLRNRLRVQSHLANVHQVLREQHRFTRTLIKRAELRLRVKPADLPAIRTNVIEVLEGASANVVCEVCLLAQSDTGIPENLLEFQIAEWLKEQGIEATLHKHHVQLHRPISGGEVVLDEVN